MMSDLALAETRQWVERVVIGLHLCPFAKVPQQRGQVRYVVSEAREPEALLIALVDELNRIAAAPTDEIETTLLIHPQVLADFAEYNEFLSIADGAVEALGLDGVIQIASFHPQYQFAGSEADDIANATNRSPHPILQLLREATIERGLAAYPDPDAIYEANIATLEGLGSDGWASLQRACRDAAGAS